MKSLSISIFTLSLMLTSCLALKKKATCKKVVVERYGNHEGFEITSVRKFRSNKIKLALGPHRDETAYVVNVEYSFNASKDTAHCNCLLRADGSFIITADDIKYD